MTDRKLTEEALLESAHFLKRIAQVTPGVLQVFDVRERRAVFINRPVASLLGYSPEEVQAMGEDVAPSFMHPEDLPRFEQHLNQVCALADGESQGFVHRMRDRDGGWHWFESHDAVFARDAEGVPRQLIGVATDITARKHAEEASAQLAAIVESSEDAMFSATLDGIVTSWNRGAEQLFGYSAVEIVGTSIMRLIPLASQTGEHELQRSIAAGEQGGHVETTRVRRDGREFPVAITVSPIKNPSGTVIGTSRIVRDITARKAVEESLRQNALLFSSIIERAPMGTYVIDADFRVQQINAEAMPAFATVQPLVGRDFREVLDVVWGAEVGRQLERIFRHTLESGERYVSPRFTEMRNDLDIEQSYEWETQRVTLPNGRYGVVCYFHEVTERAQAIKALRASEQRTRLATEATQVGSWEWNLITNTVRWDPQMFRIYGMTPTPDGKVDYTDWSTAVHPDDLAENEAILHDTVGRIGKSTRSFRIIRRSDGEHRHVEAVETVRVDARGQAESVVGTNLDVSDRVRFDVELRRLATELSETDRRKDEFLATLAHELRNPLAPMHNGLHILQHARDIDTIERVRAMMERQLAQMVHLVDDLLDVSRINQGKLELRTEAVELSTVVRNAVEASGPLIEAGGHTLTVDVPPTPIHLHADITRLGQVFSNILNNAAKYTERGGRIRLTVEREASEAVVRISDTGIGIPADMLPRIFEMFTQVDRALERSQGGLGIGLSLVQRLVEMHGGAVEARSAGAGAGSEFVVRLPTLSSPTPEVNGSATHPVRPTPRLRVLVADDNHDSADTMAMLLTMLGHDVQTAYDGSQAVRLAADFTPDVMLLDVGMPGLSGLEACRHIRQQPWGQRTVIIAVTGWGKHEDKRRSREAGFDHHMVKPVRLAALESLFLELAEGLTWKWRRLSERG